MVPFALLLPFFLRCGRLLVAYVPFGDEEFFSEAHNADHVRDVERVHHVDAARSQWFLYDGHRGGFW